MAYADSAAYLNDGMLLHNIGVAALNFISTDLKKEMSDTANHDARRAYGSSFAANPDAYLRSLVGAVLADGSITPTSTDVQIYARVQAMWDTVAGGDRFLDLIKIALTAVAVQVLGATNPVPTTQQIKVANEVLKDPTTWAVGAKINISLALAQAGLNAQTVTLAQMVGVITQLMPAYVANAS